MDAKRYGRCIICGRKLARPESTIRGYGSICYERSIQKSKNRLISIKNSIVGGNANVLWLQDKIKEESEATEEKKTIKTYQKPAIKLPHRESDVFLTFMCRRPE